MVHMPFRKLSRMLNASIGPMAWLVFLYNDEIMGDCESYFALCLAGTAAFPIVAFLGTPMVANTMWTVTYFCALRMLGYSSSVNNFLETISTAITAVVATAEDIGAWLRATEDRGGDILKTANLDFMATLRNSLFNLNIALDELQVQHLMAIEDLLDMTTRKLNVLNIRQAKATIFTTKLRAFMVTG